jgi:hypothetical protein
LIFCFNNLFWQLLPKLKEFNTKVVHLSSAVGSAVLETGSNILLKFADFVKEHEDEIKKVVHVVQEFIEGIIPLSLIHNFFC